MSDEAAGDGGSPYALPAAEHWARRVRAFVVEELVPYEEHAELNQGRLPDGATTSLHSIACQSRTRPAPSGRLGFGPPGIHIQPLPSLLVGGGMIGYKLFLSRGAPAQHPNWTVITTLARVNWRGRVAETHNHARRQVTTISRSRGAGIEFRVNRYAFPYLLTVAFRDQAGKELGEYGFYFRVVDATANARFGLSAPSYHPGGTVFARIENLGSSPVSYGAGYRIERLVGATWILAPESPTGPVPAIAYATNTGMTQDGCTGFWIPLSMPPGRYRISKEVRFPALGRSGAEPRLISGEFSIAP